MGLLTARNKATALLQRKKWGWRCNQRVYAKEGSQAVIAWLPSFAVLIPLIDDFPVRIFCLSCYTDRTLRISILLVFHSKNLIDDDIAQ